MPLEINCRIRFYYTFAFPKFVYLKRVRKREGGKESLISI